MNVPRLNRQLVLETLVRAPDNGGGFTEVWVALGTLWAEVTARTGRERDEAGTPLSSVTYKIVVPSAPHGSLARPVAEQRFREGQRIFGIQAVADADHDGRYLICHATEEIVA